MVDEFWKFVLKKERKKEEELGGEEGVVVY